MCKHPVAILEAQNLTSSYSACMYKDTYNYNCAWKFAKLRIGKVDSQFMVPACML